MVSLIIVVSSIRGRLAALRKKLALMANRTSTSSASSGVTGRAPPAASPAASPAGQVPHSVGATPPK